MINVKDVITMRIPYPSIKDGLALSAHMYICKNIIDHHHEFVKCQTLKPKMLTSNLVKHYIDEAPNINRNPFLRITRIDCDKLFVTERVQYDGGMKASSRPDVCDELFNEVIAELDNDGYITVVVNEVELKTLNRLVTDV